MTQISYHSRRYTPTQIAILSLRDMVDEPDLQQITNAIAASCGVNHGALKSAARSEDIVRAKFIYYGLARRLTTRSLTAIGRHLGGKDHTTVLSGAKRFSGLMKADDSFRFDVAAVTVLLAEMGK